MKKQDTRRMWICVLIAFILMALVWPAGLVRKETVYESGGSEPYAQTELVHEAYQSFIAKSDLLTSVAYSFVVDAESAPDGRVLVELISEDGMVLSEQGYTTEELQKENYKKLETKVKLRKGKNYRLCFRTEEGAKVALTTTPHEPNYAPGNIELVVNGVPAEGQLYNAYTYREKMNWKNVLFDWSFIWIVVGLFSKRKFE